MRNCTRPFKIIVVLVMFFLTIVAKKAYAQWVTIPDPNFVTYLTTNYPGCMSGNQLDTTCSPITWLTIVSVDGLGISDLTGIQYFDSLLYLHCTDNNLVSLPQLPATVISIYCSNNSLISLPALPPSLVELSVHDNNLTTLPTLPSTVTSITASNNFINVLPALPSGLTTLHLAHNNLSTLPTLPDSLILLTATYNNLSSLPTLPPNLEHLAVSDNILTSLPDLPSTLYYLDCVSNSITMLPSLPNGLNQLWTPNNALTSLPPLPDSLEYLDITGNAITCLPELPNNLLFLYMGGMGIACVPNYPPGVTTFDVNPYTLPLCQLSSGCPIGYNISGRTYFDADLDCSYQMGENLLYVPVDLYQSGTFVGQSYGTSGLYSFNTTLGNFDVIIDTSGVPFDITCSTPGLDTNIILSALDSIADDVNFGFKCKPNYDLGATSVTQTYGWFFPGQEVRVQPRAGDLAMLYSGAPCNTSGVSGTVQITVTGPVTYVSPLFGALTPSVAGNVLTYSISDFSLIDVDTAFGLKFLTDVTANVGEQVCFEVSVSASVSEFDTTNNHLIQCFEIVNSYDPNVKDVYPNESLAFPFNNWLTYTIHFQNTGNAPAMNIRVADMLDADLDPTTFRLLNSSHEVQVDIIGSNIQFRFNNIMLADSASNEPASHGYVQYKIMPDANLPIGTIINNTADIYFDFNSPITTNTTVNTITTPSGIENATLLNVHVYPNPASEFINVQFAQSSAERYVQLIDMLGRVVQQQQLVDINNMISLAGIANGVYSIKIVENSKETIKKIVVQK